MKGRLFSCCEKEEKRYKKKKGTGQLGSLGLSGRKNLQSGIREFN